MSDLQNFIQSVVEAQMMAEQERAKHHGPGALVTVSRDFGSGGTEIARALAERLGISVYDKEILDAISEQTGVDAELLDQLDDKVARYRDGWIRSLLAGQDLFPASYRHHLVNVLLGLTGKGGVIMGRGAHLVLANRRVFRLRVIGSPLRCAERIAERESVPLERAEQRVQEINHQRAKFVWDMFKHRLSEGHHFDLVINTDRMDDWEAMADLVLHAMRCAGFADLIPQSKGGAR